MYKKKIEKIVYNYLFFFIIKIEKIILNFLYKQIKYLLLIYSN